MSKAAKGRWPFKGKTAVVPAYEFCSFDPESKDYAEWVQEQPDNFTVRIGKLVSVADAGVQISCKTVEACSFSYNITLDEFLRYKTEGYIVTSVSVNPESFFIIL